MNFENEITRVDSIYNVLENEKDKISKSKTAGVRSAKC